MELPKNWKTKISLHGASLPDCIPCSSWAGIISINGLSNYSQIGSGESIMFCGFDDAVALTPTKPLKRKAM